MKVFVYGSMMSGYENHAVLRDAVYVGDAVTVFPYLMLDLGNCPGAVDNPRPGLSGTPIFGEVYKVDSDTLTKCNLLLGYPEFCYQSAVEVDIEGQPDLALMYLLSRERARGRLGNVVESGDWREFTDREESASFRYIDHF